MASLARAIGACYVYFASKALALGGGKMVPIGSLCVINDVARAFSKENLEALEELGCIAEALIEARATARRIADLADSRREAVERLERDCRQLKQAERIADMVSWRLTLADNLVEWSDGVFAIHELPVGQMPPVETALDFHPEAHRQRDSVAIANTIETGRPFEMQCNFVTAKGNMRRVRQPLREHAAAVLVGALGMDYVLRDIQANCGNLGHGRLL